MEDLRVDLMDVENRAEWRRRTRVADPSPEGSKPAEGERDLTNLGASSGITVLPVTRQRLMHPALTL